MSAPPKRVLKLTEFIAQGSNVTSCTIGRKSNRITATGGEDKKVNIWTLCSKPICIMSLTGHTSSVDSISFSPNEDKIVSGSSTGAIKVWDLEVNKLICNLIGHKSGVSCLEYHTYASFIASGSVDSQIRLWDLRRKACIFTYKGHSNAVNSLRFSPDNKWIASVSDDSFVKIWDLKAGKLLIDLKGHTAPVNTLEFHPNEFLLATGSSDKTVKFWDLEKMECVSTSPLSPNPVKVIMYEPNGKCLFSASNDYLQSISWEPSELYDSVYCQWRSVNDLSISNNKLIASSVSQNMVSFYAVDLSLVAPVGTPPPNSQYQPEQLQSPSISSTSSSNTPNVNLSKTARATSRRNFGHNERMEASEQPDETQPLQSDDNSQADICNQEEYDKIFRPNKEISRKIPSSNSNPNFPNQNPSEAASKKPLIHKKKVEQDFFIDIKTNLPPPQPAAPIQQQQQQPSSVGTPRSPFLQDNPYKQPPVASQAPPSFINKPEPFAYNSPSPLPAGASGTPTPAIVRASMSNDEVVSRLEKFTLKDNKNNNQKEVDTGASDVDPSAEFMTIIEAGHETLMKALRSRYRNIQSISIIWSRGDIKSALDKAVDINDNSVIADILREINTHPNVWNLDTCTILLPSIKNLIDSKYEDHMIVGTESCKIVYKNFGKLIRSNILAPFAIGVDISREERHGKCRACYNILVEIISIIEKKLSLVTSTRLINNFREINLLMKQLE